MKTKLSRILLALCIPLTAIACAGKQKPIRALPSSDLDSETKQAISQLQHPDQALNSLSGLVDVSVEVRGRSETFSAAILAKAPKQLAIVILDDLGQTQAKLVADGTLVEWWDARSGEIQSHPQDGTALKKFLKLPISISEFIARLLLKVPTQKITAVQKIAESNQIEVSLGQYRFSYQVESKQIASWKAYGSPDQRKLRYRIAYSDFTGDTSPSYPHHWEWFFRKPKSKILLDFNQPRLNPELPDEKFQTESPPASVY